MKLVGMMAARNEDWSIGCSARVALRWVDELIVFDHASTDETPQILAEIKAEVGERLHVMHSDDPIWHEMTHRQAMLEESRLRRATHHAIIDADEILTSNLVPIVKRCCEGLRPAQYLRAPLFLMWKSPFMVRSDPGSLWAHACTSLVVAEHANLNWTAKGDGYDFHAREPGGSWAGHRLCGRDGGVMHLQQADWYRVISKHALYKMTEVLRWPGRRLVRYVDRQYNVSVNETGVETQPAMDKWWAGYEDLKQYIHLGREPWQAEEVQRLWLEHGPEPFRGLNLFGVEEGRPWAA